MKVKIRSFIESDLFSQADIIAGKAGTDNYIRSINILDTLEGFEFIGEGALCLTNGYAWMLEDMDQRSLLQLLKERKAAGLMVMLKHSKEELPGDLLETADELGVPVISVYDRLAYKDIILFLENHIYNHSLDKFLVKKRLDEQMLACLGNNLIPCLARTLHRFLSKDIYINMADSRKASIEEHHEFEKIRHYAHDWVVAEELDIHSDCLNKACIYELTLDGRKHRWLSCELKLDDKLSNVLYIKTGDDELDVNEFLIIEAALRALDLTFTSNAMEFEQRVTELLDFLFYHPGEHGEVLQQEVDKHGFLITDQMGVILFPEHFHTSILHKVNNILISYYGSKLIMGNYKNQSLIIYPVGTISEDRRLTMLETICTEFMPVGKRYAAIGSGRPLYDLLTSYKQSIETLSWISKRDNKLITSYRELGSLRLLSSPGRMDEIEDYCKFYLEPILAYDKKKKSELMRTLIALADNQWRDNMTAEALFVHKNTVKYRLGQISKLLDMDISSAETRFNIECAIRLHVFFHSNK